MAKDNSKYMNWALQNKSVKNDKDKEMLEKMEQEDLNVKDSYKKQAEGWSDAKRDEFKKEKSQKEGIDYTVDLQKLNSVITEGKPVVILAVGTTGMRGNNEETFFNSKKLKDATRKATGEVELSTENIKNCANDTLTQVSFIYYEKGEDGFYHESDNPELSLKIPLINVAPSIIQRSEEDYANAVKEGRRPYDVFKEGGIDVQDLKDRKGIQSDRVVSMIDAYLNKDEIKNAILMDFQGSTIPGDKKDFATNMISHTYDAVNLMLKPKTRVSFDRDVDINLYSAINGYNLTGNRRIIPGQVKLDIQVENLKVFKGEDVTPIKTSTEKADAICYLLNEFCLREMLEKNSPETNLKIFEYCDLFNKAGKNIQAQTDENRQKLEDLRNEINEKIVEVQSELEYSRSLDETFGSINEEDFGYQTDMTDLEESSNEDMEMPTEEPDYIFDEQTDEYISDTTGVYNSEPEFDEEYDEEDDKEYAEVSSIDSVEDKVVVPMSTTTVAMETKEQGDGNLYTDKKGGMDVPIVTGNDIKQVGSAKIPEIPNHQAKEVSNEIPSDMKELYLMKKELELRSLEADLKLKEIELAKRELELKQKEPEMLRLSQNNNFALMQTFCKTVGAYLSEDKTAQKNIMNLLNEMSNIQKDYNSKMFELDEKKNVGR